MNIEDIQKFLDSHPANENEFVKITFKKRNAIYGLFVRNHRDYADYKSKNFWRIVPQSQIDTYLKTKDAGLAKIFSGSDFTRLTVCENIPAGE